MAIHLKIPDMTDRERVLDYTREFLAESPDHIPGAPSLAKADSYEKWIAHLENDLTNPGPGRVPATQYIGVREEDGLVVGVIQLRHSLNEYLLKEGGHIGYSVRPSERRKGYASTLLQLCLAEAKQLGIERVLITCDDDNIASAGVIEKAGGVLQDIRNGKKRFWITLS